MYHAPPFFLLNLDRVQQQLLDELGLTAAEALLHYNLAPLTTRRDISMLGLLHRAATGLAPHALQDVLPLQGSTAGGNFSRGWAFAGSRHNRQLQDYVDGTHSRILERSAYGLVYSYNSLPQTVVDARSLTTFQRRLQNAVKRSCRMNVANWNTLLRDGVRQLGHLGFQSCFAIECVDDVEVRGACQ